MIIQKPLKPVKLHDLLGASPTWTDELWDASLTYLLDRVGTVDAILMVQVLPGRSGAPQHLFKIDYIREFRQYPPTLLLGAFDAVRASRG